MCCFAQVRILLNMTTLFADAALCRLLSPENQKWKLVFIDHLHLYWYTSFKSNWKSLHGGSWAAEAVVDPSAIHHAVFGYGLRCAGWEESTPPFITSWGSLPFSTGSLSTAAFSAFSRWKETFCHFTMLWLPASNIFPTSHISFDIWEPTFKFGFIFLVGKEGDLCCIHSRTSIPKSLRGKVL